ncbi:hypothetical protein ACFSQ7_35485 [Paenibacillus rhizoplanae]
MYNWIQNYTKLEYLTEEEPYDFGFAAENRPRIHRLEPQPQPAIMSALAQYFIAASALLSENTYTSIPMRNRESRGAGAGRSKSAFRRSPAAYRCRRGK